MLTPIELKKLYSSDEFIEKYTYSNNDLGITYTKEKTIFKIWAPTAEKIILNIYKSGNYNEEDRILCRELEPKEKGIWECIVYDDLNNLYYDYKIYVNDSVNYTCDPYSIACGVNGKRSMILDLKDTNPEGWEEDYIRDRDDRYPVIYELHIKDFSYDKASGIKDEYRGKYLAFTQTGTTLNNDKIHKTGIDYLESLGITHVHLLPCFDFGSVDESLKDDTQFNWGYDPVNYNVPEGSYSTNPFDGSVRIKEFKQMVQALHKAGINVIMDVVYNHTYNLDTSLQKTVPYYYYRVNEDGTLSNGSACGNDTASDRVMFRKYMVDSIVYWAKEYHIDGFRFDLMGLHDVETMNEIRKSLNELPNGEKILMYGEPWAADDTSMENNAIPALKKNIALLDENISIFCDDTRDSIKGHVFYGEVPGFINGGKGFEDKIKSCVLGWCKNNKEYSPKSPKQIISYVSAHDNFTLYDKLIETLRKDKDYESYDEEIIRLNKLAAVITFTCQGMNFIQAGEEFARTKHGEDNSYNLSPELNMIDWNRAYEFKDLVEYYRGLIVLRKLFKPLNSFNNDNLELYDFDDTIHEGLVSYTLRNYDDSLDLYNKLYIAYNSSLDNIHIKLPEGKWQLLLNEESSELYYSDINVCDEIIIPKQSGIILGQK
ncbi:type I pullulanase [Clostridium sp. SM-530-WT-3G]|uniref:type I pullulanase n=1 Tax=Clostridium sp. SM-530-WT-3G TaxID=2725303 RepID=UPI00145ED6A7|nr:type I pullulanase [Clostridium sp. SM-530-WT-3G]NME81668.1 type I pullulanase [Clostridium sp. SM-530-WT-3G]